MNARALSVAHRSWFMCTAGWAVAGARPSVGATSRHRVAATALVLAVFALCGCIPRRLFWSPDGQRAAIIAEDGLRLCDAAGKLSEVVAEKVELVAWMPDSRRFIASRKTEAATWTAASAALSPARREALLALADRLREETLAWTGNWDQFKPKAAAEMSDGELGALMLYVRDHHKEELSRKLGDRWKDLERATADVCLIESYEATENKAVPGPLLARTLDQVWELRISPDGRAVACVQSISHPVLRLSVLPVGGGELRAVAEPVAMFPDWSRDSRGLVYATTQVRPREGGDALQLGTVALRRVRGESGDWLKDFPSADDLVGVVFGIQTKVRCLPDGRVLFSALEVTLPSTSRDMPQRASLFAIDPNKGTTVTRLIPRDAEALLPDGLAAGFFEVSPDATRIAVAETGKGNVSVLTLATGAVDSVVARSDSELKSIPAWRTSQELSAFVPPKSKWGSANRHEIVLWSAPDKARCLSCDWPDVFEKKTPASSPVSRPAVEAKP